MVIRKLVPAASKTFVAITLLLASAGGVAGQDAGVGVRGQRAGYRPFHLSGTLGRHVEYSEGYRYSAALASGVSVGFTWPSGWGIQGEAAHIGRHCGPASCLEHSLVTLDLVRRFQGGRIRPFVALGLLFHVGLGLEVPLSSRVAALTALDLHWMFDTASIRPKAGLTIRP